MRLHPRSERGTDAFGVLPQECRGAFEPLGSVGYAHSRFQSEKPMVLNGMDVDTQQSPSATTSVIWRPEEKDAAASLLILSMGAAAYRMKIKDVEHGEHGGPKLKKMRTEAIVPYFSESTKLLSRYDRADLGSADNEVHIEMHLREVQFEKVAEKGDVFGSADRGGGGEFEKGFDGALSFKLNGIVTETREMVKLGHSDTREPSCEATTFTDGPKKPDDSTRKKEYKCKNCNRAFPSHQALGGHCAHPGKRGSFCSALLKDVEICEAGHGKGFASGKPLGGGHKSPLALEVEVGGGYAAKAKQDIPEKLEMAAGLTRLIDLNVPFELQEGEDDGTHHLLKRCLVREQEHGPLVGPVV